MYLEICGLKLQTRTKNTPAEPRRAWELVIVRCSRKLPLKFAVWFVGWCVDWSAFSVRALVVFFVLPNLLFSFVAFNFLCFVVFAPGCPRAYGHAAYVKQSQIPSIYFRFSVQSAHLQLYICFHFRLACHVHVSDSGRFVKWKMHIISMFRNVRFASHLFAKHLENALRCCHPRLVFPTQLKEDTLTALWHSLTYVLILMCECGSLEFRWNKLTFQDQHCVAKRKLITARHVQRYYIYISPVVVVRGIHSKVVTWNCWFHHSDALFDHVLNLGRVSNHTLQCHTVFGRDISPQFWVALPRWPAYPGKSSWHVCCWSTFRASPLGRRPCDFTSCKRQPIKHEWESNFTFCWRAT